MFPSNTAGLYCPGCQPGDFAVPHICGLGLADTNVPVSPCPYCGGYYVGGHICPVGVPMVPPRPCEHCFCADAGTYYDKPHEQCCMCYTRRVKAPPDPSRR
jgi:hypothetical protein